jgi:branched-chain amino acid transport system ATP-binding protein
MRDETADRGLLSCRNISKYFGAMAAVQNLSFDVRAGQIFGIAGPNGAGKTTVFESISGFDRVDSGEVLLEGRDITALPAHEICHLGMARIFQSVTSFDSMTAWGNVLIGAAFGHGQNVLPPLHVNAGMKEGIAHALDRVGLADKANRPVRSLSVLERKFLMIATALVTEPKIILMDEPVGGLNPKEIEQVVDLLRRLSQSGITLVVIEHVMRFMVQIADQVLILHHGEKIFDGPTSGIISDPMVRQVYLGDRAANRLAQYVGSDETLA